jgi:hypothetical protein
MKNITVAVSDRANRDARVWAARRDTSLSKIVQNFLESLPNIRSARALAASPRRTARLNSSRQRNLPSNSFPKRNLAGNLSRKPNPMRNFLPTPLGGRAPRGRLPKRPPRETVNLCSQRMGAMLA